MKAGVHPSHISDDDRYYRVHDMAISMVEMYGDAALLIALGQATSRGVGGQCGITWGEVAAAIRVRRHQGDRKSGSRPDDVLWQAAARFENDMSPARPSRKGRAILDDRAVQEPRSDLHASSPSAQRGASSSGHEKRLA